MGLAAWPMCNFLQYIVNTMRSIHWSATVKPLDHHAVYIGNVIGNWLILTRVEEQNTTSIIIIIVISLFVLRLLSKNSMKLHCTTLFKHIIQRKPHSASVHLSVRVCSNNPTPPALVWPAVWPLVRLSDEGGALIMISSFKENSSPVAHQQDIK